MHRSRRSSQVMLRMSKAATIVVGGDRCRLFVELERLSLEGQVHLKLFLEVPRPPSVALIQAAAATATVAVAQAVVPVPVLALPVAREMVLHFDDHQLHV